MTKNAMKIRAYGIAASFCVGLTVSGVAHADDSDKKIKIVKQPAVAAKIVAATPSQGVVVRNETKAPRVVRHVGGQATAVYSPSARTVETLKANPELKVESDRQENAPSELIETPIKSEPTQNASVDQEPGYATPPSGVEVENPDKSPSFTSPPPRWVIPAGSKLRDLLQGWCAREGYQLSWEITDDIGFGIGGSIEGEFLEIVPEVLRAAAPVKYLAPMFQRQQKVLVVREVKR